MGFFSTQWADKVPEPKHNNLVLRTGKIKPFCLHSYSGRLSIRQSDRRIHVDVFVKLNGEFGKSSEIKLNDEEIDPHDGDVFRFPFDVSKSATSPARTEGRPDPVRESLTPMISILVV